MDVKIFQSYYKSFQMEALDPDFIPYDNRNSDTWQYCEIPMLFSLYDQHKNYDGYWGLVSWRWYEKTSDLPGKKYIDWIKNNPGYDVYGLDMYHHLELRYPNPILAADNFHPGILNYFSRLLTLLGRNDIDLHGQMPPQFNIYCHYYVGNKQFWDSWMQFLQLVINLSQKDDELRKYAFDNVFFRTKELPAIVFCAERLAMLFLMMNKSKFSVLRFPY